MNKQTIDDVSFAGRRVFIRVDFNVPLDANGTITDDTRIRAALPTITKVLGQANGVVLASHLGRPKGKRKPEFSLKPVAARLQTLLPQAKVLFADDCVGPEVEKLAAGLKANDVLLLENLRFYAEEEGKPDLPKDADEETKKKAKAELKERQKVFIAGLAKLADAYVDDAFGTAHRAHASMVGVAKALSPAVAGYLLKKELDFLGAAVGNPKRPYVAILGGAKVSDKILLISNLLGKVDRILIGGAMAYTLLAAKGVPVGKSRVEADQVEPMRKLLAEAGDKLLLPVDHVCTDAFDFAAMSGGAPRPTAGADIPAGLMGMDIGPATVAAYGAVIAAAGTVVWNGPMGVFEAKDFAAGTMAVAQALAAATAKGTITIIGGGDSASAVNQAGLADRMSHISTGGGASIEFLEGKPLPGAEALDDK